MERVLFAKIELWFVAIAILLALGLGAAWCSAMLRWEVFPYRILAEVTDFVRGDPADPRSFWTRLKAEFVYDPATFAASSSAEVVPASQLSPVRKAPGAGGTLPVIDGMRFFRLDNTTRYFVIFGSFAFPEQKAHWGAIAIDSNGVLHRGWAIRPERREYLGGHIGLAVTEEGLVATNTGGVLTAYEWCGEKRWEAEWEPDPSGRRHHDAADGYDWHHDIVAFDGSLYTFRGPAVMTVDATTGLITSEIHATDLMRWGWRDGLSLFEARSKEPYTTDSLSRETVVDKFHFDPFHFNKVDVLHPADADSYADFEAGDLLLSLRELNLVTVVRPSEERIVWWRYGLFSGQHDATFVDGQIEVFDNNPVSEPPRPRLLRLDLHAQRAELIFDLSRWNMVMRAKGNFERRGNHLLTVDDAAGRAIAGRLDGTIDFVFENGWRNNDGEIIGLQLLNATEIAPDAFSDFEASCEIPSG